MAQWTLTCWRNCLINRSSKAWCWTRRTPHWYWLKTRCTRRMLVSSLQSLCSRNFRCLQFSFAKIRCWPHSLVEDRLHSCSTQASKTRLRLPSMMATLCRRVLCGTRSVVKRYPRCFRPSSRTSTRQRLGQDTNSNVGLRLLRVKSTLMCSLFQWRTLIRLTTPGVRLR